jgi:D-amino-acid dehydrogenase
VIELWRGLRPCTPDGVPIIGRSSKIENLLLATGHQMLGLQTAPATGRLLADLLQGADPLVNPEPFRPSRFNN